jgi:hypothetical protein
VRGVWHSGQLPDRARQKGATGHPFARHAVSASCLPASETPLLKRDHSWDNLPWIGGLHCSRVLRLLKPSCRRIGPASVAKLGGPILEYRHRRSRRRGDIGRFLVGVMRRTCNHRASRVRMPDRNESLGAERLLDRCLARPEYAGHGTEHVPVQGTGRLASLQRVCCLPTFGSSVSKRLCP